MKPDTQLLRPARTSKSVIIQWCWPLHRSLLKVSSISLLKTTKEALRCTMPYLFVWTAAVCRSRRTTIVPSSPRLVTMYSAKIKVILFQALAHRLEAYLALLKYKNTFADVTVALVLYPHFYNHLWIRTTSLRNWIGPRSNKPHLCESSGCGQPYASWQP